MGMFDALNSLTTEEKKDVERGPGGIGGPRTKDYYDGEINKGKEFVKFVKAKATDTDEGKAACFNAEALRGALGDVVPQREGIEKVANAVAGSVKSLFAKAGMVPKARGAVSVRGDQVCIFPGRFQKGEGDNDYEKYLFATTLKYRKFDDLQTKIENMRGQGMDISTNFDDVIMRFVEVTEE